MDTTGKAVVLRNYNTTCNLNYLHYNQDLAFYLYKLTKARSGYLRGSLHVAIVWSAQSEDAHFLGHKKNRSGLGWGERWPPLSGGATEYLEGLNLTSVHTLGAVELPDGEGQKAAGT